MLLLSSGVMLIQGWAKAVALGVVLGGLVRARRFVMELEMRSPEATKLGLAEVLVLGLG